jgi:hypothetical protein
MRRLFLLAIAATALARGDTQQDLIDLFASMASALSESNPDVFLRAIDRSMQGYVRFAANIYALATQYALSNSIEIISQKGDDRAQVVELDWLLDISGKGESQVFVRREKIVKCRLERQKKKWRIVALEPADFFAPPSSVGQAILPAAAFPGGSE